MEGLARRLAGEARATALSVEQPQANADEIDQQARLLLFEVSASGCEDIAVYGPVYLALSGDLRSLPTLLSLSRSSTLFVRLRATQGLSFLAAKGEKRAQAQLERLILDDISEVRLEAYRGLKPLFDETLDYVELGLNASYEDVRLTALSALQDSSLYQESTQSSGSRDFKRIHQVLSIALCRYDDLGLAQEARKIYLKDQVGGSRLSAISLTLESIHDEVRRLALNDALAALRDLNRSTENSETSAGLSGQSFLFTGTLTSMKSTDAQNRVKDLGGTAASVVNKNLSYLVIGDAGKAGSKLDKAKSLGVAVISESEFMAMLEQADGLTNPHDRTSEEDQSRQWASIKDLISQFFNDPLASLRLEAYKQIVAKNQSDSVLNMEQRADVIDLALDGQELGQ